MSRPSSHPPLINPGRRGKKARTSLQSEHFVFKSCPQYGVPLLYNAEQDVIKESTLFSHVTTNLYSIILHHIWKRSFAMSAYVYAVVVSEGEGKGLPGCVYLLCMIPRFINGMGKSCLCANQCS